MNEINNFQPPRAVSFAFACGGRELLLGSGSDFGVAAFSGLEAGEYGHVWQRHAQLDGGVVTGRTVEPRKLSVTAEYAGCDSDGGVRSSVISFFDPKTPGELTVTLGCVSRRIGYEVAGLRIDGFAPADTLRFTVSLVCPSPYWLDLAAFARNMAGVRALFAFPLFIPPDGLVAAYREMKQEITVSNPGQKPVGVSALFVARRGSVTAPALFDLTTGEYVRLLTAMSSGDRLTICTVPGKKRVELNGVNAISSIDPGSSFFQLAPGDSRLRYDADENVQNLDVYPRFTPEYLGI